MIESGAEVNSKSKFDETPLYFAAEAGKIVQFKLRCFGRNSFIFISGTYDREGDEYLLTIGIKVNVTHDRESEIKRKETVIEITNCDPMNKLQYFSF